MPQYRNFRASIDIDGQPLEELSVEQGLDNERTCSCWIASEVGKTFIISMTSVMDEFVAFSAKVEVDGMRTGGHLSRHGRERRVLGQRITMDEVREFKFSSIQYTDDENAMSDGSNIGCIKLDINLVRFVGSANREWTTRGHRAVKVPEEDVSEKSKKLGSHRIGFGGKVKRKCNVAGRYEPYDPNDPRPHVTFKFFYRPYSILQALDRVPLLRAVKKTESSHTESSNRTRSARKRKGETSDRHDDPQCSRPGRAETALEDSDSDSKAEIRRIKANIEDSQRQLAELRSRKRPKREPKLIDLTSLNIDESGTIDLTSD